MEPTTCFSLERHDGPYEKWPSRSHLIVNGHQSSVRIPGYSILKQFAVPDGYLLVTDFDCPYEETTCFSLLDEKSRLLSYRMLCVPYGSFNLDAFEWVDSQRALVTFWKDDQWMLTIRPWGIPFLRPRVHLRRLKILQQGHANA